MPQHPRTKAPRSWMVWRRRTWFSALLGLLLAGLALVSVGPRAAAQTSVTLPADGFFVAATADGVRQVWRLPADGTAAYPVTVAARDVAAFAVAAQADALAYVSDGQLWVQPVPPLGVDPAPQPVAALTSPSGLTLAFSADGSTLLYTDDGLWRVSVTGGQAQQVLADADVPSDNGAPRVLRRPRAIPGAPELALVDLVGAERTTFAVVDVAAGVLSVPQGALGLSNRAVPVGDGRIAVFNNDLRVAAPLGLVVLDARALDVPLAAFAPEPGLLELVLLDVAPAGDRTLIALSQTFAPQPDGTLALAQTLAALDPATGEAAPLAPLTVALTEPVLGPQGTFVAGFLDGTLTRDGDDPAGQLVLVDAATGALLALNQDLLVSRFAWPPAMPTLTDGGPVLTPLATPTVLAVLTPTPPTTDCVNAAQFVGDVTIPDGTQVQVGVPFTKTWRVRNTGTCAWNASYTVPLVSGTALITNARFPATLGNVQPGQTVDVSVPLVLLGGRVVNGQTVTSTFQLRAADGTYFGPTLTARIVALVPCVYNAAVVANLTTPDGTPVGLGDTFTTTWRVRNTGNCAWGPNFAFVRLDRGVLEILPGGGIVPLTEPGQTADISVTFRLPSNAPVITGQRLRVTFQLRTPNGTLFGGRPYVEVAALRPGDVLDENGNVALPPEQCYAAPLAPAQGDAAPVVGERAFSVVNGLPLYSGRSNSTIVVRVPRLTSFAVLAGPYCFLVPNTSPQAGFRRWQVELDNGTRGWVNEFFGTPSTGFTYQIERDQVITVPNPIVILAYTVAPNPAPATGDLTLNWQVEGADSVRLVAPGATFDDLALTGTLSASVAALGGSATTFDVTLVGVNAANPTLSVQQTITVTVAAEPPPPPPPTEEPTAEPTP